MNYQIISLQYILYIKIIIRLSYWFQNIFSVIWFFSLTRYCLRCFSFTYSTFSRVQNLNLVLLTCTSTYANWFINCQYGLSCKKCTSSDSRLSRNLRSSWKSWRSLCLRSIFSSHHVYIWDLGSFGLRSTRDFKLISWWINRGMTGGFSSRSSRWSHESNVVGFCRPFLRRCRKHYTTFYSFFNNILWNFLD